MKFLLCLIGMVLIIEGLPYFAFPAKMKLWVAKILDMSDGALQRLGFVLIIMGLLSVYLGKK
ncbi:MAG: DUF2065 domain-containing protein [Desulfosarcina sp.]|nr:DUF2065 domain-containing protein [Desulfobacterales bacterium]